jgi:hypothetical protein
LEQVTKEWLKESLPQDVVATLRLSGFGVEDPSFNPVHWDVSFETLGKKWLGITILFVGRVAMEVQVDT